MIFLCRPADPQERTFYFVRYEHLDGNLELSKKKPATLSTRFADHSHSIHAVSHPHHVPFWAVICIKNNAIELRMHIPSYRQSSEFRSSIILEDFKTKIETMEQDTNTILLVNELHAKVYCPDCLYFDEELQPI
jgi:hypothetical protein